MNGKGDLFGPNTALITACDVHSSDKPRVSQLQLVVEIPASVHPLTRSAVLKLLSEIYPDWYTVVMSWTQACELEHIFPTVEIRAAKAA